MPLFLGFTGLFALVTFWPVFFILNYSSLEVMRAIDFNDLY